ncbi:MAG: class I SAM-dependent methyltransferase [Rhodobacteraceae bacterium]|nr:class I SAM-dependent methyltransferase [Paracoccaceae bacterium]
MGFYNTKILPFLVDKACGLGQIQAQREIVVPQARGDVLEIGIGSGLNLPFYNAEKVRKVWGLEPSAEMRAKAKIVAEKAAVPVSFLDLPGEEIPLDTHSVDTVLVTYTLCTIPDVAAALLQMRRVLRPNGRLIFCEHGQAPDASVRRWQNRLDSIWGRFSGGCHLNRPIDALIKQAGFEIETLDTGYIASPKFAGFNYWGTAKPEC